MKPIHNTTHAQYELSKPDEKYGRTLTIEWNAKKITVYAPLVEEADKPYASMEDRAYLDTSMEKLIPIKLDQRTIVYIDPKSASIPGLKDAPDIQAQKRLNSVIKKVLKEQRASAELKLNLDDWKMEVGIAAEEAAGRETAAERILEAFESCSEELNLSGLKLNSLPECIGELTSLQDLSLSGNRLTTLPESIKALTSLQKLDLRENHLMALPEPTGELTALQGQQQIKNTIKTIFKNQKLVELKLNLGEWKMEEGVWPAEAAGRANAAERILEAFERSLPRLFLAHRNLTSLPECIGELTNLRELKFSDNRLTTLPESIGKLMNLQELNLHNNQLSTLPESIGALTGLKKLLLSFNLLSTLPESTGNLMNLKELDLRDNQLSTLPESTGNLMNLQELDLQGNQLTTLPESTGNLMNLQKLDLQSNQLTTLPESTGNLMNLKELELQNNQLSTLPESTGNLMNLQELNLRGNLFEALPESIGALISLQKLNLNFNRLPTLPESIGSLTKLHTLIVTNNNLTALPESIGALTSLQKLYTSSNQLTALPERIGELRLLTFTLERNPLRSLPTSIFDLPSNLVLSLLGHNLSEQTITNLQAEVLRRQEAGESSPRIFFEMPSSSRGEAPRPIETSIATISGFIEPENRIEVDLTPFNDPQSPLPQFLHNLLATSDFSTGSVAIRSSLAQAVLKILKFVTKNHDFLEDFNLFVDTANISCVDRVTMAVIDLEIWIKLKEMQQEEVDPLPTLKGFLAIKQLKKIAQEKVATLPFFDELDIHLAYLIHCKSGLQKGGVELPFTSENMRFFGITSVTPEDIDGATTQVLSLFEHPSSMHKQLVSELFQEHDILAHAGLKALKAAHPKEAEEIQEEKAKMFESLEVKKEEGSLTDQEYQDGYAAIQQREKDGYVALLDRSDRRRQRQ